MTEPELAVLSEELALVVRDTVIASTGDLRDRLVVLETRAAAPVADPAVADLRDRVVVLEQGYATGDVCDRERDRLLAVQAEHLAVLVRDVIHVRDDVTAVRERVAVIAAREPVAGPPGPAGPPGADGRDGKDGTAGLRYLGVFVQGKTYDVGDGVTWAGSMWHCNMPTTTRPGEASSAWTLMVKRGRDGRDGAIGLQGPPGPAGRDLRAEA